MKPRTMLLLAVLSAAIAAGPAAEVGQSWFPG
jgi:hypothetical protein